MKNKRQVIPYRRKREGKTNYKKRIAYLTSTNPRLVIRKSLKSITAQLIIYQPTGDRVLASANSVELKKLGWKLGGSNTPACYLVGYLIGTKAKKSNITEANADVGIYKPIKGSKLFAVIKGAVDAGLGVSFEEDIAPNKDRLEGKHIADYKKVDVKKQFDEIVSKIKGMK